MPTYGPWMDDAADVETGVVASNDTAWAVHAYGWTFRGSRSDVADLQGALQDAWAGETLDGTFVNYDTPTTSATQAEDLKVTGAAPNADAEWKTVWLTIDKPTPPTISSSTPPPGYESPPGVIGVEWEPTTTVLDMRLVVKVYQVKIDALGDYPFHVKMQDDVADPYMPTPEVASVVAARPDVATITTAAGIDYEQGEVSIVSPPLSLTTGGRFAVTVLDGVTQVQDVTMAEQLFTSGGSSHRFSVQLHYIQRPRYRLIYADVAVPAARTQRVTPSLRMLQRGGSGGMSGIPRMVGDPTRRGIRQGPGSVY